MRGIYYFAFLFAAKNAALRFTNIFAFVMLSIATTLELRLKAGAGVKIWTVDPTC